MSDWLRSSRTNTQTQALCEAVTNRDRSVLRALVDYAKRITPKLKPGPKPQKDTGEYIQDQVGELILSRPDLTSGQIAQKLTGDPKQDALMRAHWSRYKKGAGRQKPS